MTQSNDPLSKVSCTLEKGIIYLRVATADRKALDHVSNEIIQLILLHDLTLPFLLLSDYSEASLTPYASQKAREVYNHIPSDLYGRSAVLLNNSAWGRIMETMVNQFSRPYLPQLNRRFFTSRQESLAWLEDGKGATHR